MRKGIDCKGVEWEEREITTRMLDLRSMIFGQLKPLFPVKNTKKNREILWLCECICGNQIVKPKPVLMHGDSESCGCLPKIRKIDTINKNRQEAIGQKFGKLTVLEIDEIRIENDGGGRVYYKCLCDCGNINPVVVRGTSLKSGHVTSCGCAKKDRAARDREDLVGKKFGKLTVTEFAYVEDNFGYWRCKCDCGNTTIARGSLLKVGSICSCGCLSSVGEFNIMKLLDNHSIKYLHNKGFFQDLMSDKGVVLRYDFILFNNDNTPIRLIEFDGPQHYDNGKFFGMDNFDRTKMHDKIKNQYALTHNIPLVRIPYSKRDTMTIEDLLGDKYLIKGEIDYGY